MGEGFQFFDIILLAMLAAFIGLRLRSVLGRRTGNERHHPPDAVKAYGGQEGKVVALNKQGAEALAAADTPLGAALGEIAARDQSFDTTRFLESARKAYQIIVTAFAKGDTEALRPLLDDKVYGDFASAIEKREEAEETAETRVLSATSTDIVGATLNGRLAKITIKFVSELLRVINDREGRIIDGHPTVSQEVTDVWTFARDPSSRDPNWALVATRSTD